jgi:hypothetical protein
MKKNDLVVSFSSNKKFIAKFIEIITRLIEISLNISKVGAIFKGFMVASTT